ncbi:Hsp20/alpha crystallin family protein [Pseudodesulfovibrio piezophilus]|uniref:Heat shock protein Hsp20 n=1 Tax=Pseudodesulfovibrio piezophilus (strain DSM 21447 / JCM 15486 / C1TLV30) TaxID=1322246 RepID=M1WKJ6_PSEP2|nr:Hsp20/alpha crystallin family protein [Pseudodesulfovibrio piezophilus]CCH49716.1 Heat shock protein Hsp20 [Pseudodesulfovibrio piezophilus C1TLV30]
MSELAKKEERNVPRYRPATDIIELEDGFRIYIDLPGVKREDLTIDLQDDELAVSGRTSLDPASGEHFLEMQFGNCEYMRSISVTDIIDRENIKANLEGGVLELVLPKVRQIQPRQIEITQL